jgi:hypothetical protein
LLASLFFSLPPDPPHQNDSRLQIAIDSPRFSEYRWFPVNFANTLERFMESQGKEKHKSAEADRSAMTSQTAAEKDCPDSSACDCRQAADAGLKPDFPMAGRDTASCCGEAPPEADRSYEAPGLRLWGFVEAFMDTPEGPVPRVSSRLNRTDRLGNAGARLGVGRNDYRIAPGLYAVGMPQAQSPVLVSANYKLSFDHLRACLSGIDAWIMVVDTRGINVWCAAGKGIFCAREVAGRVKATGLEHIVTHRRLVLPQLSATGVNARQVKSMCGFEVIWGPVRAADIGAFLDGNLKATPAMRKVTFTLRERMALIPVELNHLGKPTLYLLPALFLLSGLGSGFFSVHAAVWRGLAALTAYVSAVTAGAILVPILLPWLPGRTFALKGAGIGALAGALFSAGFTAGLTLIGMLALTLFITALSSYLAMNFTGSTPFTSPTGVEKEMRKAIPAQAVAALAAIVLWIGAGFIA